MIKHEINISSTSTVIRLHLPNNQAQTEVLLDQELKTISMSFCHSLWRNRFSLFIKRLDCWGLPGKWQNRENHWFSSHLTLKKFVTIGLLMSWYVRAPERGLYQWDTDNNCPFTPEISFGIISFGHYNFRSLEWQKRKINLVNEYIKSVKGNWNFEHMSSVILKWYNS